MAELIKCEAEVYHARPERSNSQISDFIESPRTFYGMYIAKDIPRKTTKSMDLGTVVHKAVLESRDLGEVVMHVPDSVLSASGCKAGGAWKDFEAKHAGKILLKASEYELVCGMFDAIYANPQARKLLLSPGEPEATILWDSRGHKCRSRIDRLTPKFVVDLKTTADPSPREFERSVVNFRYHNQNAFYLDAATALDGQVRTKLFVTVENKKPHRVGVHQLNSGAVESGRGTYEKALDDIARRMESNQWADWFETNVNMIGLPGWFTEPPIGAIQQ